MPSALARSRRRVPIATFSLLAAACVVVSTTTSREPVEASSMTDTEVTSPIRAHLVDGSMILFSGGFTLRESQVRGTGQRFDVSRQQSTASDGIPLDSVIGFEVYQRRVNPLRTLVYGASSLVASVVSITTAAVVLFGSCPTIYGDSSGIATLQAESFSYSISPLLAKRDVDRMTVRPDSAGVVRLAVRNEALETHHLDHMEIIEVRHRPGEVALPSPRGGAIAVSELEAAASTTDRSGRNVSRAVAREDGDYFSTNEQFLDRAIAGGPTDDHLTIAFRKRPGVDSVALVLRARSSLLTTSVLYEHLMGRQGALALDWMGGDLQGIAGLAALASWYGSNFGMRVEVQDGAAWRSVIRLMDFGPTAWRQVGVVVPAVRGADDSVRIRLTFAADAFRIDHLTVAHGVRRVEQRRIPIARAIDAEGALRTDIVRMLSAADDYEVEAGPGAQIWLEFNAAPANGERAPATSASSRTFFFAAQGYYVEWLRPAWMKDAGQRTPFSPSTTSMRDLLLSWKGGRDSLEALFFTRRVPIA